MHIYVCVLQTEKKLRRNYENTPRLLHHPNTTHADFSCQEVKHCFACSIEHKLSMTPASRIVCRCSVKHANAASEEWSWWRVAVRRYVATLFPMLSSSFKSSRVCGLRSLCLCVMMLLIIWVCHGHHVQTNTESEILFLSAIEF